MANEKLVEAIADMETDFAQWYTDVVRKAELADYSSVKGFVIIRPYGFAIWEGIQKYADARFKETGHENVSMPLLIPESMLQREKDHVEGFAPEVAWVTHGGEEKLQERLCIRPTSEVLFCEHYANVVQSYRDLPKLYNQWCSVVRWEKTTRPFLRTREFNWQEGHTAHATEADAQEETLRMLEVYAGICENYLAIPVISGRKTDREKFAGAKATYTVESMMHDGKALQGGTTHNFGDGFAKAFGIQYSDRDGQLKYAHQTSWGISTRLVGAIIMVHGDNNGLVLPPKAAPIQLVIVPVAMHKAGVLEKANELKAWLSAKFRVKLDDSDKNPGWKFAEYEMKGVPLRVEIGPKDIENNQAVLARRDTGEKIIVSLDTIGDEAEKILDAIQKNLFDRALKNQLEHTYDAHDFNEFKKIVDEKPCFINGMWCGSGDCEAKIKELTTATSRCIPFEQKKISDKCVCCGKPADTHVIWGKAY